MSPKLNAVEKQVARNCAITDSRHARIFSVCGLALRLRSFYKWRKGLDPWVEEDPGRLLEWIEETENAWEELEKQEFRDLRIGDAFFDPFDAAGINDALEPFGLIYGAGYVQGLSPSFFLARLAETRTVQGCRVFILGKELARDLLSVPALSQERRIYIRREIVEAYLWDRIFFMNRSGKKALNRALSGFGVTEEDTSSLKRHLPEIVRNQIETHIFHELGEILDPAVDRKAWRELLAAFPNTVIELLARTLKDLLADTSVFGTLPCIVRERDKTSLDLFAAFFDGLRRVLCPEMIEAYEKFSARQDWDLIAEAIRKVYTTSRKRAEILMDIFLSGKARGDLPWAEREIRRALIDPLGLDEGGGAPRA